MLMKGGRIPDYIFKSAQTEEEESGDNNIMQIILDRIWDNMNARERDVVKNEEGDATRYFIAENSVNISDIEKAKMINYLSQYDDIENDEDLETSFREYLLSDFSELSGYSQKEDNFFQRKDYFDQLAGRMAEEHVGSCEILDVTDKVVSLSDNRIYVGFEFVTHETVQSLKDKWTGI